MKRALLLLLTFTVLTFIHHPTFAQSGGSVKAHLVNSKSNEPVEFAMVAVVKAADSATVTNANADQNGRITITGLAPGNYKLVAKQLGLAAKVTPFSLSTGKMTIDLGKLIMQPDVKSLSAIVVEGQQAPVRVKKDTVEFNAGSYKTQPNDNVEQLLKKLPGVEVDRDGKVTAQGQQVSKVYVDGKEFFGNDPKAAIKNLPADAIAKVQVIDDKTEKTKNTGIDDGQREKVLNLTLKEDKKKGWFGNASASGGNTDRFLGQFNINRFDKQKQVSALFLSNNINESGFSMEDLNAFTGGNTFDAFRDANGNTSINIGANGRANVNGVFSGVSGGLITNHTGGLNYSDLWGKKDEIKFNSSFVTVVSNNTLVQDDAIENPAQNLLTTQRSVGENKYNSYRLNMNLEYKMDSLTTMRIKPNLSYGYRSGRNTVNYNTTSYAADPRNLGNQFLDQTIRTPVLAGQFSVNRRIPNGRGSYNMYVTGSYSPYSNKYSNNSLLARFNDAGIRQDSLSNLYTGQTTDGSQINGTLSHIRQINKKQKLNLTVSQNLQYRHDEAEQATLNYNAVTGNYDILNPQYSGDYNNTNYRYSSSVGLNKATDKLTVNLSAEAANLGLKGQVNTATSPIERNQWVLAPSANISYRPKPGSNFYFYMRNDALMPAITDLQPFLNTANTNYKRIGNPDLRLARYVTVSTNFNTYDQKTNNYINFYASYNYYWNGFSTESFTDEGGVTTSRPINADGNYNLSLGTNLGRPSKIKGLRFNLGLNGNLNRNINFINDNKNSVLRISPGLSLGSSFDRDNYQFSIRTYTAYNNAKNSYQSAADRQYFSFNNWYSASVKPVKNWRIFSELFQNLYRGKPSTSNTSVYLLNAGIERYLLKGQNLTIGLNAFDLLDQNAALQRSLSNTGQTTRTQTNTIGQYFSLRLTYKISRVGTPNSNTPGGMIIMR
ncbi:TonB-dependent receptor [Mucilaginibacter sp. PAMB04274]|uniref:TonB-dependent receptor n=1 Tax=Mucilaginibacter sp. PAMB04274 TaxID=3138568 RepID=UPI0031F69AB9